MSKHKNGFALRVLATILLIIVTAIVIIGVISVINFAYAEGQTAYILRRQADNVLIRKNPTDRDYVYSKLVDNDPPIGAELELTGETHGQWLKCRCLYLAGQEGWVHESFVVYDKPQECGRVATVIRPVEVGGYALVKGDRVKVLYRSNERSTTIWGMVPTDALDFNVTGEVTQPRRLPDWIKRDHILCVIDWW